MRVKCISILENAPERLLAAFAKVKDSDMSCCHLSYAISGPAVYRHGPSEQWKKLLEAMIDIRWLDFVRRIFAQLQIDGWLYFQDSLRAIFFSGTERPSSQNAVLSRNLSRWSKRLSARWLPALRRFESIIGNGSPLE
jgi:hypothetical protein